MMYSQPRKLGAGKQEKHREIQVYGTRFSTPLSLPMDSRQEYLELKIPHGPETATDAEVPNVGETIASYNGRRAFKVCQKYLVVHYKV